jgi:hypothetical protein
VFFPISIITSFLLWNEHSGINGGRSYLEDILYICGRFDRFVDTDECMGVAGPVKKIKINSIFPSGDTSHVCGILRVFGICTSFPVSGELADTWERFV